MISDMIEFGMAKQSFQKQATTNFIKINWKTKCNMEWYHSEKSHSYKATIMAWAINYYRKA